MMIEVHNRGSIFHGLHYEDNHPLKNGVLYPYSKRKRPTKVIDIEQDSDLITSNGVAVEEIELLSLIKDNKILNDKVLL
jgi:adenine specific DNA methylase Mod